MPISVDTQVQYIKGVGPKVGDLLKKKGILTLRDLIEFYPRAYEDRRAARSIASLQNGDHVGLRAQIARVHRIPLGRTGRKIYDIVIKDESGMIHCKFFRVPYKGYFEKFATGTPVRIVGKVILYRNQLEFHHPELYEINDEEETHDEIVPIYSETEGLSSKKLHSIIVAAMHSLGMPKEPVEGLERLPPWLLKKYNLLSFSESVYNLHVPKMGQAQSYLDRETPYHRRIIFDEFFLLEMVLAARKKGMQSYQAPVIELSSGLEETFFKSLPFELTGAQKKVIEEIKADLVKPIPMNRLVQGDVGSGKTMVAFVASLPVIQSRYQVALMAPTEILAQQHAQSAKKFLGPLGIEVDLLSGQLKGAEKAKVLEKIKNGDTRFIVGTHALIQEGVEFLDLGLVIVDEQHRFGVEQRGVLRRKGSSPHFLLMTATPIPRSLAMTVYGDLDVSAITEMPKGRQAIVTRATFQNKRPQVLKFVKEQLDKGRQAYIIFPLVDESEKIDLKSAITEYERLVVELPQYRLGLLHGRMKSEEKDEVMERFRNHELDILVSTTVIEVGVDVANANIMWVEHAERFGLSQLHQLRGRVGRGEYKSYCILMMGYANSVESQERVQFLETTNDGFKVAEFDLELRGPGEFLGVRQSGMPGFKMANIIKDLPILEEARKAAFSLLELDPKLMQRHHQTLKLQVHSKQMNLG